jgi:hypothetical protein
MTNDNCSATSAGGSVKHSWYPFTPIRESFAVPAGFHIEREVLDVQVDGSIASRAPQRAAALYLVMAIPKPRVTRPGSPSDRSWFRLRHKNRRIRLRSQSEACVIHRGLLARQVRNASPVAPLPFRGKRQIGITPNDDAPGVVTDAIRQADSKRGALLPRGV